ncbi:hypothetical protein ACFXTI_007362 [Malus domestica]
MKDELRALLFKDCFAWSYREMPGLDRTLVEHELRIKPGCKPFRQLPRRFSTEKNDALRICIDFRNLNLATPKDEYTMPISDLLIDVAANHAILSFMDGHAEYNQIFIAEADVHKTAFRCPGALGTYEWAFLRMRQHNLKMNPAKCAFGVSAGNFLGFLVHHRGIEVDENKARAIISAPPPTTKKQLQSLLGKINFLRRFIANSAGKMKAFSKLLKLKDSDTFAWMDEHQVAFTQIKVSLTTPPVLVPLRRGKPLKLYISAAAAASLPKITMSGESRLFSTSVEILINRRSIIPPLRSSVLPFSSPPPSFGITCFRRSHKSLPRPTLSGTCLPGQS